MRKTDNSALERKLRLRRYFLDRYHEPGDLVFDACQGRGVLWRTLRREFDVRYWGVDEKEAKGRMKIRSERILALPGHAFDIIDIDTYGSPWKHWLALLPNVTRPTSVFLTVGQVALGVDKLIGRAVGWGERIRPPGAIARRVQERIGVQHMIRLTAEFGVEAVEAVEAKRSTSARYIGVRIQPKG